MNSLKTTIVCVVLLGVLYGMYQVINTPEPTFENDDDPLVGSTGEPFNPEEFNFDEDTISSPPSMEAGQPNESAPPRLNPQAAFAGAGNQAGPSTNSKMGDNNAPSNSLNPLQLPGSSPVQKAGGTAPILPGSGTSPTPNNTIQPNRLTDRSLGGNSTEPNVGTPIPSRDIAAELAEAWVRVDMLIERSRYSEALATLSKFYGESELTAEQTAQLQQWLDALAAKVIYSMEHTLVPPHLVVLGDSIERLAKENGVPVELLQNINRRRLDGAGKVIPGTELKRVQGPFRATLDLSDSKLVLWLDEMYAGSFPVRFDSRTSLQTGIFSIVQKSNEGLSYMAGQGYPIEAGDPANPYGQYALVFGQGMIIHGPAGDRSDQIQAGSIVVSEQAAKDLYEILSRDSEIQVVE